MPYVLGASVFQDELEGMARTVEKGRMTEAGRSGNNRKSTKMPRQQVAAGGTIYTILSIYDNAADALVLRKRVATTTERGWRDEDHQNDEAARCDLQMP
jgi:hypothetical protein